MPPLPSRDVLEAMKRVDLQRLCKDYGVKANLKSEALIDLLLDTQSTRQPTRRSVSTRHSSRAGPSRVSSVIIHNTDDEQDDDPELEENDTLPPIEQPPPPPPRTRKGKELQTRLGVGRPVAAGGSGPRAVTKSSSVSRSGRGKSIKTMKQVEAIIEEEPETADEIVETSNDASRSNSKNVPDTVNGAQPSTAQADLGTSDDILSVSEVDKRVAEALRPLHEQLRALKSQVEEIQHLKTELADLKPQIADLKNLRAKVDALTSEIRELRTQQGASDVDEMMADSVHEPVTPPQQSTPQPKTPKTYGPGGFGMPSAFRTPSSTAIVPKASSAGVHDSEYNPTEAHPGVAASMLGKRHRDSVGSSITGIVEEGHEDEYSEEELAKRVVRPTKKRPRISKTGDQTNEAMISRGTPSDHEQESQRSSAPHVPSFTVFRGPEGPAESYVGSPPPTNHLPEYFNSTDSGNRAGRLGHGAASTSSATASENQQPFNFSFLPISSTPANATYASSFPFPEAPQSPSPAGSNLGFLDNDHDERTDVFKPYGLPSPHKRLPSFASGSQPALRETFVDPAALTQRSSGKQREVSTNDGEAESTNAERKSDAAPGANVPSTKRTMYGTELEGDTRFGDFGMDGVASIGNLGAGFWAGGRF